MRPLHGRASVRSWRLLAPRVERNQRRLAAEAELGLLLDLGLEPREWIVIPSLMAAAGVAVPYFVLGRSGAFVLAANDTGFSPLDLGVYNDAAGALRDLLPGYPGPVNVGVVSPFTDEEPRLFFDGAGVGGWALGGAHLHRWLRAFRDRGFSATELAALREECVARRRHVSAGDIRPSAAGLKSPQASSPATRDSCLAQVGNSLP